MEQMTFKAFKEMFLETHGTQFSDAEIRQAAIGQYDIDIEELKTIVAPGHAMTRTVAERVGKRYAAEHGWTDASCRVEGFMKGSVERVSFIVKLHA